MPRIKVDLDDSNAWGTDGHDDEDGYYRAECGRCGSEDRWYIGDYGDWRFTDEQPIGMGGWYSTEVEDENSCFSIVRCGSIVAVVLSELFRSKSLSAVSIVFKGSPYYETHKILIAISAACHLRTAEYCRG